MATNTAQILLLNLPLLVITQDDILEVNLPSMGRYTGTQRINHYQHILALDGRQYIRFTVKTKQAFMLFSEKNVNLINRNTDTDYIEVNLGCGSDGSKSRIGIGSTVASAHNIDTPNIVNINVFKYLWISWYGGKIKVGRGFQVEQDIIIQSNYPSTIHINNLALYGWGFSSDWNIFTGISI